jgi:hypothetical protein
LISSNNKGQRKYVWVADSLNKVLYDVAHNFNDEDSRHVFKRFLDKESVQALLLEFVKHGRKTEKKLKLLESMKDAYAQLVAQKAKDNLPYRNALLIVIMSNQIGPFQHNISRTIGNTMYFLSKVITQIIHVDFTGDSI